MNQPEWMSDPTLAGIDKEKLDFLQKMVFEGSRLSQKEMLPFLMNVARQGKNNRMTFTPDEMNAVIAVLRKNSTPEELERINKIMNMKRK